MSGSANKGQLEEMNGLKKLNLFETICKILNIPMELKGNGKLRKRKISPARVQSEPDYLDV